MNSEEYIKRWLDGSLNEAEKKEFEASTDFKSIERLLRSVEYFRATDFDQETELKRLLDKRSKEGKQVNISWIRPLLRAAAVLVIIFVSAFYFYLNKTRQIETLASEKVDIYLPDSSFVNLNASTTIAYKINRWESKRSIELDGEAFFEVAKGSRFDVETEAGTVSVLGTSFNVTSRATYFEVICYEGLVQVKSGVEISKLDPGDAFRLLNGKIEHLKGIEDSSPPWLNNESAFRSVPFHYVLAEFERQYDISTEISGFNSSRLFTGKFPHNNTTVALQAITSPFDLEFELTDEQRVILTK